LSQLELDEELEGQELLLLEDFELRPPEQESELELEEDEDERW
jgi:hypothetical protein